MLFDALYTLKGKKIMKKLIALLLATVFCLSLVACASTDDGKDTDGKDNSSQQNTDGSEDKAPENKPPRIEDKVYHFYNNTKYFNTFKFNSVHIVS